MTMALSVAQARDIIMAIPKANAARHMDRNAFRAGGRIFATLRDSDGTLNLMLPLDYQEMLCEGAPKVYAPVPGGWGPMGWTHFNLANATERDLNSALEIAVKDSLVNRRKTRR